MDSITITEALVAQLVERDDVDATNAIGLLRTAAANVAAEYYGLDLNAPMDLDAVDSIIIGASRNGRRDIFAA